jgi:saccharopine dehydrogenase-like NADP-dependent oxidoreductase
MKDGEIVSVPGERLFDNFLMIPIPGLGAFEGYPNRDSVPYREIYGIPEARTVLRGTLRYPGWCPTLKKIGELGFLDETERPLVGRTYQNLTAELAGKVSPENLREGVAQRLGLESGSDILERLEWLGLFSEESLPIQKGSALDVLADRMIQMLSYAAGERDMIVLQHEFQVSFPGGRTEEITSTLIDYGIPGGESSMSRTVGLPAAIAGRLVLEKKVEKKGVQIPVFPELYGPILDELNELGIKFSEKRSPV